MVATPPDNVDDQSSSTSSTSSPVVAAVAVAVVVVEAAAQEASSCATNSPTVVGTDNNVTSTMNKLDDDTTTTNRLLDQFVFIREFINQANNLVISASNVAALVGLHPYKSVPELVLGLIYQGQLGRVLQQYDANYLGLSLLTPQQQLQQLATKAGIRVVQAVQQVIQVQNQQTKLSTTEQATALHTKVYQLAQQSNQLSVNELTVLREASRQAVATGFGVSHEDTALNWYEQQCGWPIRERNVETRYWDFVTSTVESHHNSTGRTPTVQPLEQARSVDRRHYNETTGSKLGAVDSTDVQATRPSESTMYVTPFFRIAGKVDGIRDELIPNGTGKGCCDNENDDDSWILRRVVVECKHRMRQLSSNIPVYEQVQAVAYCFMFDATVADVVQVLRRQNQQQKHKGCASKKKKNHPTSPKVRPKNRSSPTTRRKQRNKNNKRLKSTASSTPISTSSPSKVQSKSIRDYFVPISRSESTDTSNVNTVTVKEDPPCQTIRTGSDQLETDIGDQRKELSAVPATSAEASQQIQDVTTSGSNNRACVAADSLVPDKDLRASRGQDYGCKVAEAHSTITEPCVGALTRHETAPVDGTDQSANKDDTEVAAAAAADDDTGADNSNSTSAASESADAIADLQMSVTRIELDDPHWQHRKQWQQLILPRLRSIVEAVYNIRRNDEKRQRFLSCVASADTFDVLEGWHVLHNECPWLQHCDTAYHRDVATAAAAASGASTLP